MLQTTQDSLRPPNEAIQICSKNNGCSGANRVIGTLYQGDRPPVGADLTEFSLLVLCAIEWQPRARDGVFIGVPEVYHCPLDDDGWRPLEDKEIRAIKTCAHTVAEYLKAGKKVLSTCAMGLNRSGVVSAMSMRMAYGLTAKQAIILVRAARGGALSNGAFVRLIETAQI